MSPQPQTEEVPYQHIITELEQELRAKTSELVIARARIRVRDEHIDRLRSEVDRLHNESE